MTKRLISILLPVVLIAAIVIGGLSWIKKNVSTSHEGHSHAETGGTAEDFDLTPYGQAAIKFSSIDAKVILVNFWATWCEACVLEMPSLVDLRNKLKSQGFELLPVSVDENPEAVLPRAIKEFKFNFPAYTDKDGKLAEFFGVAAIPHTVILDKARKILWTEPGERNWTDPDIIEKITGFLKAQ